MRRPAMSGVDGSLKSASRPPRTGERRSNSGCPATRYSVLAAGLRAHEPVGVDEPGRCSQVYVGAYCVRRGGQDHGVGDGRFEPRIDGV